MSQEQVKKFITTLCTNFNLNKKDVKAVWSSISKEQQSAEDQFKGLKKTDIVSLCKTNSIRCTGTVGELVRRLTTAGVSRNSDTVFKAPAPKAPASKGKGKGKGAPKAPASKGKGKASAKKTTEIKGSVPPPTVEPLKSCITTNEHGNFMHSETRFVFNRTTTSVYGIQQDDGSVKDLTSSDIETVKKHGFKYDVPSNLANTSLVDDDKSEDIDEILEQLKNASPDSDEELEEELEEEM
jgi:hypothetical protein